MTIATETLRAPEHESFRSFARAAIGQGQARELWGAWEEPLARLLAAASRGEGHVPWESLGAPDDEPPSHLVCRMGSRALLPRQGAAWQQVRDCFAARAGQHVTLGDDATIRTALDHILPHQTEPVDNRLQRMAVAGLCDARAGVLTGGPGTGKTATVAALLALCLRLEPELGPEAILLAAPTGKAANRLRLSVGKALGILQLEPRERQALAAVVPSTLHRALGWSPIPPERGGPWRHGPRNPLPQRLVLLDESSMADVELMAALCAALAEDARLILIGDSDQLESVEAGGVLAELVQRGAAAGVPAPVARQLTARCGHSAADWQAGMDGVSNVIELSPLPGLAYGLRDSWRACSAPWILRLATLVRPGASSDVAQVVACCAAENRPQALQLVSGRAPLEALCREAWTRLLTGAAAWTMSEHPDPTRDVALTDLLDAFQLLVGTNAQVDAANRRGCALAWQGAVHSVASDRIPHGAPVIVEANLHAEGIANGDLGIALGTGPGQGAKALLLPGRSELVPLAVLPRHRPAFAITIHKSQGSEWRQIAVDLPTYGEDLIDRHLLYTAITRSAGGVLLRATEAELVLALGGCVG